MASGQCQHIFFSRIQSQKIVHALPPGPQEVVKCRKIRVCLPIWRTSDFNMCVNTLEVEFALTFHQTNKNTYDLSLNSTMNTNSIETANLFEGPMQNISVFVSKARPHRRKSRHQYAKVPKTNMFLRAPCRIYAYLGAKSRPTNKTVATNTQKYRKRPCVLRAPCRIYV